jgi:hypothetical protein
MSIQRVLLGGALCAALALCPHSLAQSFDLKADWSDALNPNGAWSYNVNGSPAASTFRTGDTWTVPQPSWGNIAGWFKSNGTESFPHDWIAGDVITHSPDTGPTDIVWTAPSSGTIDVSGVIWPTRDVGRTNIWRLFINGSEIATSSVASGDPYDRANPMSFASAAAPGALDDVPVAAGQTVRLLVTSFDGNGDYAGVNLSITLVPEPAAAGLLGLALLKRRRPR